MRTGTKKIHVLGRKERIYSGILNIGRYYALDGSLGSEVYVDCMHPHIILICGKRGYGKSYTIGVFIEEMALLDEEIRKNIAILVIDTLGLFWTTFWPNLKQKNLLEKWDLTPKNFDIMIFSSEENVERYKRFGIPAEKLVIKTPEIDLYHWSQLFNLMPTDYESAVIGKVLSEIGEKDYSIDEIIDYLEKEEEIKEEAKLVVENFFHMAKSWKIFGRRGIEINNIAKGGRITVIDLSSFSDELKRIIVSVISRKIFYKRIKERKNYEEATIHRLNYDMNNKIPLTWLVMDEAHIFLPSEECISKNILVRQWLRQGRQFGLSMILATQRPSSLDREVFSHSDIIISHRLTSYEDLEALNSIRPTYMNVKIEEAIKKIGEEKGTAIIIDDNSESIHVIKIRPRLSWHGGDEITLMEKK
ncbi:MAG TPA: ATP-binding protein [Thermoplasmatales archaeon]|nr:ATP-binding protein [Thermoplasmatales archaeon]